MTAGDQDARTVSIYDTRDFSKPPQVLTPPIEPKVGMLQTLDWSPDGRSFLLNVTPPTSTGPNLWTYDIETGLPSIFAPGGVRLAMRHAIVLPDRPANRGYLGRTLRTARDVAVGLGRGRPGRIASLDYLPGAIIFVTRPTLVSPAYRLPCLSIAQ
jgi:hypothetical protein